MDSLNGDSRFLTAGFPHSDICGSSVICTYPQLFAACHVLLRLSVPGHSPCALSSLTLRSSLLSLMILRLFSFNLIRQRLSWVSLRANLSFKDITLIFFDYWLIFILILSSHLFRYFEYSVLKVQLSQSFWIAGGDNEIRTHDPLLARQVLSQLSYTPMTGLEWTRTTDLTLIRRAL